MFRRLQKKQWNTSKQRSERDIGAFVFAGDETTVSVSGKEYITADRVIESDDIITIDLSPQIGDTWGDYARTIIIENGNVVKSVSEIVNDEWRDGLLMEKKLHDKQKRRHILF